MREDCTSKWKLNVAPPKSGWRDRERERDRKYGYDGEVAIDDDDNSVLDERERGGH